MPAVDRQRRRVATGMLIILAMGGAAVLIFSLNRIVEAVRDTYQIVGVFYEAPRLQVGSTVRLAGYPVGEVTRIELLPPGPEEVPPFAATLRLPIRYREEIRTDSRIRLTRQRLLSEPVVEIYPGTLTSPILPPGDTLRALPPIHPGDVAAMARTVRASFDTLLGEGKALRTELQTTAAYRERLRAALEGARARVRELERTVQEGPLTSFLDDPRWRRSLAKLELDVATIVDAARERARTARGAETDAALTELVSRAERLTAQIRALQALLDAPLGFPERWESDPAIREAITSTRAHLDSLIEITKRRPWRYFF